MSNAPSNLEPPSGTHALPRDDGDATFRLPRGTLVLIIAALLGGGGVSGMTALLHGGEAHADPQMVTALAEINAKLTVMTAKLDNSNHVLDDHEARLRTLEKKAK